MTGKQITDSSYYQSAKTQTFYKGDQFYEVMCFILEHIETVNKGESCELTKKYAVSIKILNDKKKNYKKK